MKALATLCTEACLDDLKVFFFSLQLWNTDLPKIYLYCDTAVSNYISISKPYTGPIELKVVLDKYSSYTRAKMEQLPGIVYKSLFWDFVVEKTHLLEWALTYESSILFCDADICFMASLPYEPLEEIVLSPHNIRDRDIVKYGIYNAGYMYFKSIQHVLMWRESCATSRFYEQQCLETLPNISEFTNQHNYGWWRLLQGEDSLELCKSKWSIKRTENSSGIAVEGLPLYSIHTHWKTNDMSIIYFNKFILEMLSKLLSVKKTKELYKFLKQL